jgi:hypothetical protein
MIKAGNFYMFIAASLLLVLRLIDLKELRFVALFEIAFYLFVMGYTVFNYLKWIQK